MATAKLIDNASDFRTRLRRSNGRLTGSRVYQIADASNIEDALAATGLPADGDPWSATLPLLRAIDFDPEREQGQRWYKVTVSYTDDPTVLHPEPGTATTTQIQTSEVSQQAIFDHTGENLLNFDRSPVPVMATAIELHVIQYSSTVPDLGPLLDLCAPFPKINKSDVILPNYLGGGGSVVVPAGELLYRSATPILRGDVFGIDHKLLWSRSWDHLFIGELPDGTPSGDQLERVVYKEADFPAFA